MTVSVSRSIWISVRNARSILTASLVGENMYAQAIDYLVDEEEKQVNVMAIFNAKRDYMCVMKKYI